MRKFLTAVLSGIAGLTVLAVVNPASAEDWSGVHVIGLAGLSTLNTGFDEGFFANSFSKTNGGLTGGIGLGADYVHNKILFGVDADISLLSVSNSVFQNTGQYLGANNNWQASSKANSLATMRVRAGHVVGQSMIYVTGGVAMANFDVRESWPTYIDTTFDGSASGLKVGGIIGVGLETHISANLTTRVEGLYARFQDIAITDQYGDVYKFRNDMFIARVGLSMKL